MGKKRIQIYTPAMIAEIFGVKVGTVYQWVHKGWLPVRKKRKSRSGKWGRSYFTNIELNTLLDNIYPYKKLKKYLSDPDEGWLS